jgi:hypothetical protein
LLPCIRSASTVRSTGICPGGYGWGRGSWPFPTTSWPVLRVAAYAALMTDRCPPFRLDIGGIDRGSTLSLGETPEPCDIR